MTAFWQVIGQRRSLAQPISRISAEGCASKDGLACLCSVSPARGDWSQPSDQGSTVESASTTGIDGPTVHRERGLGLWAVQSLVPKHGHSAPAVWPPHFGAIQSRVPSTAINCHQLPFQCPPHRRCSIMAMLRAFVILMRWRRDLCFSWSKLPLVALASPSTGWKPGSGRMVGITKHAEPVLVEWWARASHIPALGCPGAAN